MNESYAMPSMPEGSREGILRGMHRIRETKSGKVRLLGAGTILTEVIAAADLLEKDWGIAAEVHSVTSFTELRRNAMTGSRAVALAGTRDDGKSWIEAQLPATGVPVVAASDYVRAVADLIRPWIADRYVTLGTDGFGRSDTRANLRRFFAVDRHSIAIAALGALGDARGPSDNATRWTRIAAPWTR